MTSVTSNIQNILHHTCSRTGYPCVERQTFTAVREVLHNSNLGLTISYHILGTDQRNSLIAREHTRNCFCVPAHGVQMMVGAGSGVAVDTGVKDTDTQSEHPIVQVCSTCMAALQDTFIHVANRPELAFAYLTHFAVV